MLSGFENDAAFFQKAFQFALLEHLFDDVAATDEFTLDVKLRNGRPIREFLDPLTDFRVLQNVNRLELDPNSESTWTTAAEKPHWGKTGVPFMKSSTSLWAISWAIRSWTGFELMEASFRLP